MAISDIEQAIRDLLGELARGQVSSQEIVDMPEGMLLTTTPQVVIPPLANAVRLVMMGNVGNQHAFFAIDFAPVPETGIVVPIGNTAVIFLGPDRTLNGVTNQGMVEVCWQSFGSLET